MYNASMNIPSSVIITNLYIVFRPTLGAGKMDYKKRTSNQKELVFPSSFQVFSKHKISCHPDSITICKLLIAIVFSVAYQNLSKEHNDTSITSYSTFTNKKQIH